MKIAIDIIIVLLYQYNLEMILNALLDNIPHTELMIKQKTKPTFETRLEEIRCIIVGTVQNNFQG